MNLVKLQDDLKMLPLPILTAKSQGQDPQVPPWLATAVLNERMDAQKKAGLAQGAQGDQPSIAEQLNQKAGLMALQGQQQQQAQQQMMQKMAQAPQPAPANVPQPEQQPQPQMMAQGGLARLPVNPRMFDYRAGGIIGFNGVESSDIPEAQALDTQRVEAAARAKKIKELQDKIKFLRDAEAPQAAQYEAELAALLQPQGSAGIPTALPKPAPPVALRPASAARPVTPTGQSAPPAAPSAAPAAPSSATPPGMPSALPNNFEQSLTAGIGRAEAEKGITPYQAKERYAAIMPDELKEPAGLAQLARLKQQQEQYEKGKETRPMENWMRGLAAAARGGIGGFGTSYLDTAESNRTADAAQVAYQNQVMTAVEAARRGEATTKQKALLDMVEKGDERKAKAISDQIQGSSQGYQVKSSSETARLDRESREKEGALERKLRIQLNNTPPAQRATVEENAIRDYMKTLGISYSQAYEKVKQLGTSAKGQMTPDQAADNVGKFLESMSGMQYVSRLQKEAKDAGKPVPDIYAIRKELIKKELGSQASTEPTMAPPPGAVREVKK